MKKTYTISKAIESAIDRKAPLEWRVGDIDGFFYLMERTNVRAKEIGYRVSDSTAFVLHAYLLKSKANIDPQALNDAINRMR